MFNLRRNIIYFIAFLGIFLFSSFSEPSPAYAFEQLDLDTLLNTYQCAACDLTLAELEETALSGADLSGADLSGADLEETNLSDADLSGAFLSDVNFNRAIVKYARFGGKTEISESMKDNLIKRGAIFEDSPGERSEMLSRV